MYSWDQDAIADNLSGAISDLDRAISRLVSLGGLGDEARRLAEMARPLLGGSIAIVKNMDVEP